MITDRDIERATKISSETSPTSRRRLNPRFVEWLMGFPIGWTELCKTAPKDSEGSETL